MGGKKDKKKEDEPAEPAAANASTTPAAAKVSAGEEDKKKKRVAIDLSNAKKTNLGDTATIKRLLDDAAIDVLLNYEELGYVEDTTMSNLKLVIGFSAVGASLLSHVYPAPFPRNWWCLLVCCSFYFIMSGVMQLLLTFVELESILALKASPEAKSKEIRGLNVSSHFPRFQELFTLAITPVPGSGRGVVALASAPAFRPDLPEGNSSPYCMQRTWSVEKYFDEDGIFAEDEFMESVKEFVIEYQACLQGDGTTASKKKQ